MFQQVVPLSADTHRALRFAHSQPFDFASSQLLVPVTAGELDSVAREMPIVFGREGGVPQALMGYEPGRNLHVQDSGHWVGRYIPAHIRRFPFILSDTTEANTESTKRRFTIFLDSSARHLSDQTGERLFDDDGQPTKTLLRIQEILTAIQRDSERSKILVAQLESRQLLQERKIKVEPVGGEARELTGFRVVDTTRLAKLPAEQLAALRDSGALAMVYAHLLSLSNLRDGWIAKHLAQHTAKPDHSISGNIDELFNFDSIDWSKFGRQ